MKDAMALTFIDRAKKHFGYLESELGFKVSLENNSEVRPQTDGVVEYTSDTTVIVIDSETVCTQRLSGKESLG